MNFSAAALTGLTMMSVPVKAYQEPSFKSVHQTEVYEVRLYDQRLVAEVKQNGKNNGFRALFNYISGDNEAETKMQMTIPVTQSIKDKEPTMHFFLPKEYAKDSAPIPTNANVSIKTLPKEYIAVIRYSGFASDSNFEKHAYQLKAALEQDNIEILGEAVKATYNSPFTLPFFRRNEAMIKVNWQ